MNRNWSSVAHRERVIRRVLLITAGLLAFAVTACCWGDDRQAVVRIGNCSGVCVDPSGLILTVKHCRHRSTETVQFPDRSVIAHRVYVTADGDGPVVFDCEGNGHPWIPVASQVPPAGSVVSSSGYPALNGRRVFRRETGTLVRGVRFRLDGQPFDGNVTTIVAQGGWSGGPLLDERGHVCGLLSGSDSESSVFISFAATRKAYEAVKASKPTLWVFSTRTCTGCLQFKGDFETDPQFREELENRYLVEFVDADLQPELARKHRIEEVPTFVGPGVRVQGYPGKQELLNQLALRTGVLSSNESPAADWSHVLVVVLAAEQDVGRFANGC